MLALTFFFAVVFVVGYEVAEENINKVVGGTSKCF